MYTEGEAEITQAGPTGRSYTPKKQKQKNASAIHQLPQIEKWCIKKVFEWIKATRGNLCSFLISKVRRPLTC